MPKYSREWHEQDMQDELDEYSNADAIFSKWSEVSDVVYTYTRARWSGHQEIVFPLSRIAYLFGLLYMFPKYTLRWMFFRAVARRMGSPRNITEVRNPRKLHKLHEIAERNELDPNTFSVTAERLIRWWPLLP